MRIALALLAAVAVLALPSAASAQAPPSGERATAQAFADALERFAAASEAAERPDSTWLEPCERAFARVPRAHRQEAVTLMVSHSVGRAFAGIRGPLRALRSELADVATADPVLVSGRAAVRRLGRALDAVPAPGDFCAELRAWRRAGYPSSAIREASAAVEALGHAVTRGIVRKLNETAQRLRALGVSSEDAGPFGGGSW